MIKLQKTRLWRSRGLAAIPAAAVVLGVLVPAAPAAAYVPNSMSTVAQAIGARTMWFGGYTGKGADIAIIDTGVSPVAGLNGTVADGKPKLYHGPDLSFESQNAATRYFDTYGHGTHMAGIMAGKDDGWTPGLSASKWSGIAPDSKILSVKIGESSGAVDVTQMIAAIYWVVQHRRDNGLNIRVLNLAYSTNAGASLTSDALLHAVEVATRAGIVVVVASGNTGYTYLDLANPAMARDVIAVGAVDTKGTLTRTDDAAAPFSANGSYTTSGTPTGSRPADTYAPGASIESLAVPGSFLDLTYPGARSGTRFFRGSGTSQAAAVISGAAALLISERPAATPAQIKQLLANSCPAGTGGSCAFNSGLNWDFGKSGIDLMLAKSAPLPSVTTPTSWASTGAGSVDSARGSSRLTYGGVTLSGEKDIFGRAWNSGAIAKAGRDGTAWTGGTFNGAVWAGTAWSGNKFITATWTNNAWFGAKFSSVAPSTNAWSGGKWTGGKWTGGKWTGGKWTGDGWASAGWG